MRDAAGRAQVVDGAVAADIATRGQVDAHVGAAVGAAHGVGRWPGDRIATARLTAGIDLNTVRTAGFYDVGDALNRPADVSSWLFLHVQEHPPAWCAQTALDLNSDRLWTRRLRNDVWHPWVEIESVAGAQAKVDTRLRNDGGDTLRGGLAVTPLAAPTAPTVTVVGAAGTTTYRYRVTARSRIGETTASPETTITNGNATLSATNLNRITWAAVPGAVDYRVWRIFSGGTPATTGAIATVAALTVDDTGLAAAGVVPTADTSGAVNTNMALPTGNIIEIQSPANPRLRFRQTVAANSWEVGIIDAMHFTLFDVGNGVSVIRIDAGGGYEQRNQFGIVMRVSNIERHVTFVTGSGGNVGIGTLAPTTRLDVAGDTLRLRIARTPASATASGEIGEICWDGTHVYVCVAANTWRRAAITAW
ncbi:MAG: hypothetical protein DDT37_01596 [Firmicutes bacterium]|nr:hypothetical protein [candidate division NPL-UPA2 bacterium]